MKKLLVIFAVVLIALIMVVPAFAQATEPPPATTVPASVGLLDLAFFVATVAFFKARFKLADMQAFYAAIAVGALFAFAPQLIALLPTGSLWVEILLNFIKFVVLGTGTYNFASNIAPKFAAR